MIAARRCNRGESWTAPQLILGLAVMLLGLVLVLDNFGLLEARRLVRLWPVLLIGAGLLRLYHSLRAQRRPCGFALILIGVAILLVNLDVVRFRQALAVFLLAAGGAIAWRARHGRGGAPLVLSNPDLANPDVSDASASDPSRQLDLGAFMAYISRAVGNPDFRGGRVTSVMGACEIDLRGAAIAQGEAVIDVFAFWGGIELKVPADWLVEARGTAVLGAFEDSSRRPEDGRQKLIVTGTVIMGGLEVKN